MIDLTPFIPVPSNLSSDIRQYKSKGNGTCPFCTMEILKKIWMSFCISQTKLTANRSWTYLYKVRQLVLIVTRGSRQNASKMGSWRSASVLWKENWYYGCCVYRKEFGSRWEFMKFPNQNTALNIQYLSIYWSISIFYPI